MPETLPSGRYYISQKSSKKCLGSSSGSNRICALPINGDGIREFVFLYHDDDYYTIQLANNEKPYLGYAWAGGQPGQVDRVVVLDPKWQSGSWDISRAEDGNWIIENGGGGFPWVYMPGSPLKDSLGLCSGDKIPKERWHWQITTTPPTDPEIQQASFPPTGHYTLLSRGSGLYLGYKAGDAKTSDVCTLSSGVKGHSFFFQQVDRFGRYFIQAFNSTTTCLGVGGEGKLKDVHLPRVVWTLVLQSTSPGEVAYAITKLGDTVYPFKENERAAENTNPNTLFWRVDGKHGSQVTVETSPYTLKDDVPVLKDSVLFVVTAAD